MSAVSRGSKGCTSRLRPKRPYNAARSSCMASMVRTADPPGEVGPLWVSRWSLAPSRDIVRTDDRGRRMTVLHVIRVLGVPDAPGSGGLVGVIDGTVVPPVDRQALARERGLPEIAFINDPRLGAVRVSGGEHLGATGRASAATFGRHQRHEFSKRGAQLIGPRGELAHDIILGH